jgi:hypothetical protein
VADVLSYADPPTYHRVRAARVVWGTALAVSGSMLAFFLLAFGDAPKPAFPKGLLLLLAAGSFLGILINFVLAHGSSELRIAGERLYLRVKPDAPERVVDLADIQHLAMAGAKGQRHYLRLRDSECIEIPEELVVPMKPFLAALHAAAPHIPAKPKKV